VRRRWTKVDPAAAARLTAATLSPGIVYPLDITELPGNLQTMPGAESYFVSAYTSGVAAGQGVLVTGEMAVVRRDGKQPKGYNYVFATSSGGGVYYTGPFKQFEGHHMSSTGGVAVANLFGHSPWHK
jgi:hypothetical protein